MAQASCLLFPTETLEPLAIATSTRILEHVSLSNLHPLGSHASERISIVLVAMGVIYAQQDCSRIAPKRGLTQFDVQLPS